MTTIDEARGHFVHMIAAFWSALESTVVGGHEIEFPLVNEAEQVRWMLAVCAMKRDYLMTLPAMQTHDVAVFETRPGFCAYRLVKRKESAA